MTILGQYDPIFKREEFACYVILFQAADIDYVSNRSTLLED